MMKKVFIIKAIMMFAVFINVFACNGQTKPSVTSNAMEQYFGETVANIIASPSKVRAYILTMNEPTEKSQTIGGFVIEKKLGNVKEANYSILQFLLQDNANYLPDSAGVRKCFFEPYLAFEFVKGKETAYVLLAFNCECWGVIYKNKSTERPHICQRQLLRFAQDLLPNDKYINKLLTFQEEKK